MGTHDPFFALSSYGDCPPDSIIFKDVLLIDSSKHDMINAGSALCPFLSRHVLMLSCLTVQI